MCYFLSFKLIKKKVVFKNELSDVFVFSKNWRAWSWDTNKVGKSKSTDQHSEILPVLPSMMSKCWLIWGRLCIMTTFKFRACFHVCICHSLQSEAVTSMKCFAVGKHVRVLDNTEAARRLYVCMTVLAQQVSPSLNPWNCRLYSALPLCPLSSSQHGCHASVGENS